MLATFADEALDMAEQAVISDVVRRSITLGLQGKPPCEPIVNHHTPALRRWRSSLVTLRQDGKVIGHAGTVEPTAELIRDVCHNAYEAASHAALRASSKGSLTVDVCLIKDIECLTARSFDEVCSQMETGEHGVLLQHAGGCATLTPDKWHSFQEPTDFLQLLWQNAKLLPGQWPQDLHVIVYRVQSLPSVEVSAPEVEKSVKPK